MTKNIFAVLAVFAASPLWAGHVSTARRADLSVKLYNARQAAPQGVEARTDQAVEVFTAAEIPVPSVLETAGAIETLNVELAETPASDGQIYQANVSAFDHAGDDRAASSDAPTLKETTAPQPLPRAETAPARARTIPAPKILAALGLTGLTAAFLASMPGSALASTLAAAGSDTDLTYLLIFIVLLLLGGGGSCCHRR